MEDFDPLDMRLSQVAELRRMAGLIPPEELAGRLGLTPEQLSAAAEEFGADVRHREPRASWCDECGEPRVIPRCHRGCPVCRNRETLARAKAERAAAYEAMDPRDQAVCGMNNRAYGVRFKAAADLMRRPRKADYDLENPHSEYVRSEEEDRYAEDLQAYEVAKLQREIKTTRKSLERWRKKASDGARWAEPGAYGKADPDKLRENGRKGAQAYERKRRANPYDHPWSAPKRREQGDTK